jgi:hypothetical protein
MPSEPAFVEMKKATSIADCCSDDCECCDRKLLLALLLRLNFLLFDCRTCDAYREGEM